MSENYVIPAAEPVGVPVNGGGVFPVRRIFCVGKNYADHVKEMGGNPKHSSPVFFTKPSFSVVTNGQVSFPSMTNELHFEGELVVVLGTDAKGPVTSEEAKAFIFGFAAGCDLTRRDLQAHAKEKSGPWDTAKAFEQSAPVGEIMPLENHSLSQIHESWLKTVVNGTVRQDAPISSMIWDIPALIAELSRYFKLCAGDLIFTGTPEGVGELRIGDKVEIAVCGLPPLVFELLPEE